ncbi:hypothetical protein BDP81DRAFT_481071 [Colletotrichum phormii]|uniref:Uncharacterized protein n=1 Tax=Colletotrichum phormii TaxID=359342 RepID=A0AAI9ZSE4_9PEZI|nr:uncharacterized protein BDP81DRAFT_481071 [Colletotrichum phormii]KAK1637347.1 hypothetical protein BDP81DRAFT_481071 [Colletotrichum phormii]
MSCPLFFVVARVVGSDGSLEKWKQRLIALCAVSATEPLGNSYYWGHDLSNAEPDTLWGLEGYTHPAGFFLGPTPPPTPDYDLHHCDLAGGWLKRDDDPGKDSQGKEYQALLAALQPLTARTETHLSQIFNGHIDQRPKETGV